MRRWRRQLVISLAVALGLAGAALSADDPRMVSQGNANGGTPLYSINESEVGGTGDYASSSNGPLGGYSFSPNIDDGGSTLGDTFAGNSSSNGAQGGYQLNGGFNTTAQPRLGLTVNSTAINLGALSTSVATTASTAPTPTFTVLNYTSYGYAVTLVGSAPTNAGHALAGMGTQSANSAGCSPSCTSAAGVEQFGVNLKLNSSPVAVGADPVQVPSSSFSYGAASGGYATANSYRFFSGDTIASAPKSSGETDYTMSFLANISNLTPGGTYKSNLAIVATGTY